MRTTRIHWKAAAAGTLATALTLAAPATGRAQHAENAPPPQNRMGAAGTQLAQKITPTVHQDLEKLHAVNQAEIAVSQIALQHANSPQVKQLASTLGQQHAQLDQNLLALAQQAGINLQGPTFQNQLKTLQTTAQQALSGKQGPQFDLAYTNLMVQNHNNDLKNNFPKWIKNAQQADLPQVASLLENADTAIQHHLQLAQQGHAAAQREVRSSTGVGGAGAP